MMVFLHLFSERKIEEWESGIVRKQRAETGKFYKLQRCFEFREIYPFQVNLSELFSTVKQKFTKFKSQL